MSGSVSVELVEEDESSFEFAALGRRHSAAAAGRVRTNFVYTSVGTEGVEVKTGHASASE